MPSALPNIHGQITWAVPCHSTDDQVAEGTVTVNGDNSLADVVFPSEQLQDLKGNSYVVYGVDKNGREENLKIIQKVK